jgi:peptide/nickel transport system permease protein
MSSQSLAWFIGRRLAALAALLLVVSFGVFALLYAAPGSPEQVLLGTRPVTPATIAAVRAEYHLDDPFLTQYWLWLHHAVALDLGTSLHTGEPVMSMIGSRLLVTVGLGLYAFVLTLACGLPLGVLAAVRSRSVTDRSVVVVTVAGISSPPFFTGLLLLYVFAVSLGLFPVFGPGSGLTDRLAHLTLPAITLALTAIAVVVKLTRAAMIQALDQDFVLAARARGIDERRVILSYALRNALIPVVTSSGLIFGYMLTGTVLVEQTFALPGVGALLIDAVGFKDVPVVQGIAILATVIVVIANLAADVLYLVIDPRLRFGRAPR